MVKEPTLVRFTREMMPLLMDAGLLTGESYELLDGELHEMPLESPLHSFLVEALATLFSPLGFVRQEKPMAVGDDDLKPDVALYDGGAEDYKRAYATWARFVIEVAASTRARDLGPKAMSYSRAGVPTYWVVDLVKGETVVHTVPSSNGYLRKEAIPFAEAAVFGGVEVDIARLIA